MAPQVVAHVVAQVIAQVAQVVTQVAQVAPQVVTQNLYDLFFVATRWVGGWFDQNWHI